MSSQDFSPAPYPYLAGNGGGQASVTAAVRSRERYWLHGLLFALTLLTTTAGGRVDESDFERNTPFDIERFNFLFAFPGFFATYGRFLWHPSNLLSGLPFSLTLMTILLAHEMGHYLAAMYHRVDASLPYFLPSPLMGTFGAFIRVRSPIYSKRALFDIGVAGPLAGFVFLMPALAVGLAFSKVIPNIAHQGEIQFGAPALQWLLERADISGRALRGYLSAPGGAGRVGGDVRHGAEPAAHRPTGWRPHSIRVLSAPPSRWFRRWLCIAAAAAGVASGSDGCSGDWSCYGWEGGIR